MTTPRDIQPSPPASTQYQDLVHRQAVPQPNDVSAAQAAIAADRQQRTARCLAKIQAALEDERCELTLSIVKIALGNGAWGDAPQAQVTAR